MYENKIFMSVASIPIQSVESGRSYILKRNEPFVYLYTPRIIGSQVHALILYNNKKYMLNTFSICIVSIE